MNKNRIRLTESQLHRVIKESVKKVLNEARTTDYLGRELETPTLDNHRRATAKLSDMNFSVSEEQILDALNVLGICLTDVYGGKMWSCPRLRQHYWDVNEALEDIDLSFMNKLTHNDLRDNQDM